MSVWDYAYLTMQVLIVGTNAGCFVYSIYKACEYKKGRQ